MASRPPYAKVGGRGGLEATVSPSVYAASRPLIVSPAVHAASRPLIDGAHLCTRGSEAAYRQISPLYTRPRSRLWIDLTFVHAASRPLTAALSFVHAASKPLTVALLCTRGLEAAHSLLPPARGLEAAQPPPLYVLTAASRPLNLSHFTC